MNQENYSLNTNYSTFKAQLSTHNSLSSPNFENDFYTSYFNNITSMKESEKRKTKFILNCLYWLGFSSDIFFAFVLWSFLVEFFTLLFRGYFSIERVSLPPLSLLLITFFLPCIIHLSLAIYYKTKLRFPSKCGVGDGPLTLNYTTHPPLEITPSSSSINIKSTEHEYEKRSSSIPISSSSYNQFLEDSSSYYYRHPSPSYIFGSESVMRILDAEDDNYIMKSRRRSVIPPPKIAPTNDNPPNISTNLLLNNNIPNNGGEVGIQVEEESNWKSKLSSFFIMFRRPLFYSFSILGILTNGPLSIFVETQIDHRLAFLTIALSFLFLQFTFNIRDISINKQSERGLWSFLIGWIVFVNVRFGYVTLNPLFIGESTWKITLITGVFYLLFLLITCFEEIAISYFKRKFSSLSEDIQDESIEPTPNFEIDEDEHVKEVETKGTSYSEILFRSVFGGLSFGCLLFVTHWLFSSATTMVRWCGLSAFPYNIAILFGLSIGLVISSVSNIFRSAIGFVITMTFAFGLAFIPNNDFPLSIILLVISTCMSLVLPTIWTNVLLRKSKGYTYFSLHIFTTLFFGIGTIVYIIQVYLTEICTPSSQTASSIVWISSAMRQKPHSLLITSCLIIGIFGIGLKNIFSLPRLGKSEQPPKPCCQKTKTDSDDEEQEEGQNNFLTNLYFSTPFNVKQILAPSKGKTKTNSNNKSIRNIDKRIVLFILFIVILTIIPSLGYRLLVSRRSVTKYNDRIIVLTFNVHNGYDMYGRNNFRSVLNALTQGKANVIGLQQSDTNKISSSSADIVEYLAFYLDLFEYYGPTLKDSTYGCSILSAYPLEDTKSHLLPSNSSEQSVIVQAFVLVTDDNNNSGDVKPLPPHHHIFDYEGLKGRNATNNETLTNFYFFSTNFAVRSEFDRNMQIKTTEGIIHNIWKTKGERDGKKFNNIFIVGDLNVPKNHSMFSDSHLVSIIDHTVMHNTSNTYDSNDEQNINVLNTNVVSNDTFVTIDYILLGSLVKENHIEIGSYKANNASVVPISPVISRHNPLLGSFSVVVDGINHPEKIVGNH
ncbi:hypothetical protein ABK040_006111 [Willaertia magna]